MRLPVKLALLLAATTALPLLLATAFTLPQGREALRSQLDQIYAQDARALAAEVHRTLVDKLDALTLAASTLRLGELEPVDEAALTAYAGKVPLQGALQAGLAIGPVYVLPDATGKPIPRLVLAVVVAGAKNAKWVLGVEISLRRLAESFERFRPGESGAAFLLDGEGKVIVHTEKELVLKQASMKDHPLVKG